MLALAKSIGVGMPADIGGSGVAIVGDDRMIPPRRGRTHEAAVHETPDYNLEMNIGRDKNALFDRAGPAKPVCAIHAIWPNKFAKTCYKRPIQK
jgi:hypothetical protein